MYIIEVLKLLMKKSLKIYIVDIQIYINKL